MGTTTTKVKVGREGHGVVGVWYVLLVGTDRRARVAPGRGSDSAPAHQSRLH